MAYGERLTNGYMYDTLEALRRTTGYTQDYAYDNSNGGWKLVKENGSVEVSTRLSKRDMYNWIWAYINGIQEGRKLFIKGLKSYEVLPS